MARKRKKTGSHQSAEQAFLAAYDASRFPHPSLAVDVGLITVDGDGLSVVLVRRTEHPGLGKWSLPGGFVRMDESLEEAATRLLRDKAGAEGIFLEQLFTFGEPDRDPRTRVVTVAYYALVDASKLPIERDSEDGIRLATLRVPWKGERGGHVDVVDGNGNVLQLAFDHNEILGSLVQRLRGKLNYAPIGFELLPKRFTLRQLQQIHEAILDRKLNKDSFRRRMLATGLLVATGELEQGVGHRPAELYRFKRRGRSHS